MFQVDQLLEIDKVRGDEQRSIFMPRGQYWQTEKGTIVYWSSDNKYSTIPQSLHQKIANALNYLSETVVNNIKSSFQKNDPSGAEEFFNLAMQNVKKVD